MREVHWALVPTTQPTERAVTLSDVKEWARINANDSSQNVTLMGMIDGIMKRFEDRGRALTVRSWNYILDSFPYSDSDFHGIGGWGQGSFIEGSQGDWGFESWRGGTIRLPLSPVASVDLLTYVDMNGSTQTLANTEYQTDLNSEPARIIPAWTKVWPVTRTMPSVVTVSFTAGVSWLNLDADIKNTIKQCVATMYYGGRDVGAETEVVESAVATAIARHWPGTYR